jgi:predicted O-linked N-acetylglucosamine transferase (SPINDLY family)
MPEMTVHQALQLAVQHHQSGKLADAERLYRLILQQDSANPDALHLLGVICGQSGRRGEGIGLIRKALEQKPGEMAFLGNLGRTLLDHGEVEEAIAVLRRAAAFSTAVEVHNSLGNALRARGEKEEALAVFQRALKHHPRHAGTHYNIGNVLRDLGRMDEAIAAFGEALRIAPIFVEALNNLGNALKDAGRLDEALARFREVIRLRPHDAGFHSNILYTMQFHPGYAPAEQRAEFDAWESRHAAPLRREWSPHGNARDPQKRLRVGYVSPDFWQQAECYFVLPLLAGHDHDRFEIVCYSSGRQEDGVTERMKRCADRWVDVREEGDGPLADRIRADRIDILVDLTMHMSRNRLPLFARKPAPVQVTWLAYPGTTGLSAMDYRLTDALMDPPGTGREAWYSEASVALADCWCAYDPVTPTPEVWPLPALASGIVTFGSLNNFCKVNEGVLALWAAAMGVVPGSRLLMLAPEGSARETVRKTLEARGIGRDRVHFENNMPRETYLRLYHEIDLGLDPFPYNGITTTCDSLWMGVPVLSRVGGLDARPAARAGLSLLTAAGVPEFACATGAEFVEKAQRFAGDLQALAQLRAGLRERMKAAVLMDGVGFARKVEGAFRRIWQRWCEGGA